MPMLWATTWRGNMQHPAILTEGTCAWGLRPQMGKLPRLGQADHQPDSTTQSRPKVKRRSDQEGTVTSFTD